MDPGTSFEWPKDRQRLLKTTSSIFRFSKPCSCGVIRHHGAHAELLPKPTARVLDLISVCRDAGGMSRGVLPNIMVRPRMDQQILRLFYCYTGLAP